MKNFIQYLSESQKLYEFRIKVANCDPAEKMEELKAGLAGYVVDSISAPKTLPRQHICTPCAHQALVHTYIIHTCTHLKY
jgi:hypothetical protein